MATASRFAPDTGNAIAAAWMSVVEGTIVLPSGEVRVTLGTPPAPRTSSSSTAVPGDTVTPASAARAVSRAEATPEPDSELSQPSRWTSPPPSHLKTNPTEVLAGPIPTVLQ